MSHLIRLAGGVFSDFHEELVGAPIDFRDFDPNKFPEELLEEARQTWRHRVHTEFLSTQAMTRFLAEVTGAGDPFDIYAGALDLIEDEIKHTWLCMQVCRALGVEPDFPSPVTPAFPQEFYESPMAERALATAISMVTISETLSVGFLEDLATRCKEPGISDVLQATYGDEEGHEAFGWTYVSSSLKRFPESTMPFWRDVVQQTLKPHFDATEAALANVPKEQQRLDNWPDEERIPLGLFSRQRQALIFQRTYESSLAPRLRELHLL